MRIVLRKEKLITISQQEIREKFNIPNEAEGSKFDVHYTIIENETL